MQIAIQEAKKAMQNGEIPVGCIIVNSKTNTIISQSHNQTKTNQNQTHHAEMLCINNAFKIVKQNTLQGCDMYVTLEPCPMCAFAICLSKIDNLYIGTLSEKTGSVVSNIQMFEQKICNHKTHIYHGFMEEECAQLLKTFFQNKRN
ncbi:MAG: hypothetical protein RL208_733 [Pseudomonadota bacterium]